MYVLYVCTLVESPLQRYSRLKMELEQLKFDLDGVVVAESQQSASIYSLLQHETNALVTATRALEGSLCLYVIACDFPSTQFAHGCLWMMAP